MGCVALVLWFGCGYLLLDPVARWAGARGKAFGVPTNVTDWIVATVYALAVNGVMFRIFGTPRDRDGQDRTESPSPLS